jgi:oligopeptide/dipeptide ABC transporter ATP-binding protein
MTQATNGHILEVRQLKTWFQVDGVPLRAVDGASFSVRRGSVLALVGESGCGKSVTAYSILRLIQYPGRIVSGQVLLHPRGRDSIDVTALRDDARLLYELRGGLVSMIFQEPMSALSPVHTIGSQIGEAILLHRQIRRRDATRLAADMLARVGLPHPEQCLGQYPHEMSGGMRQRVMIAMALVADPQLIIADEPTTALDVTIQAQVLKLLDHLRRQSGASVVLITHDLGVVAQMADEVAVMYLGRIVERGDVRAVLKHPLHPYTRGLLQSLPSLTPAGQRLPSIPGSVPSLHDIPAGCPFHTRCPLAQRGRCDTGEAPTLTEIPAGRALACPVVQEAANHG